MSDLRVAMPGTIALWAHDDGRWTYRRVLAYEDNHDGDERYWTPLIGGELGLEGVENQWRGWEYVGLAHADDLDMGLLGLEASKFVADPGATS